MAIHIESVAPTHPLNPAVVQYRWKPSRLSLYFTPLTVGHSHLTHSYLLSGQPKCADVLLRNYSLTVHVIQIFQFLLLTINVCYLLFIEAY